MADFNLVRPTKNGTMFKASFQKPTDSQDHKIQNLIFEQHSPTQKDSVDEKKKRNQRNRERDRCSSNPTRRRTEKLKHELMGRSPKRGEFSLV